jgi:hypothetical protein
MDRGRVCQLRDWPLMLGALEELRYGGDNLSAD